MEHQIRLKSLADDELLAGLSSIVRQRNQITAEFLAYLAELDQRQLFLDLGYPSLFDYCVRALGLCESTAGRHIAAARVCRDHPQTLAMVARGELHASALSLMKKHVTVENAAELFESCTRKSARQVEVLLATRFPRPDVADLIRRLPTPNIESGASKTVPQPPDTASSVLVNEEAQKDEVVPSACPTAPEPPKARRPEPLSADRYGVHFTADGEFCELLERVRGLAGHRLPSGDLLTLLKHGLEAYERELEKERFSVGRKPKSRPYPEKPQLDSVPPSTAGAPELSGPTARVTFAKRTRRRPAAVTREVFLRDGKQCSYVSADGRRCTSRRCLELDHVQPWAMGGADEPDNLRVRCRAHNQRYARQCYGELHVRSARARKLQHKPVRALTNRA
ncbi:MAG: HNH endonuclease signature motif containing protein [Polyangiaceae bacterium]